MPNKVQDKAKNKGKNKGKNKEKDVVLEMRNVSRTFNIKPSIFAKPVPLHAVSDLSIKLYRNEIVGLVGESGCGKSTLARMLLGLMPVTEGEVLLDGQPLSSMTSQQIAKIVQPIFQDPYSSLNPRKQIWQIVAMPLIIQGVKDKKVLDSKVREMLDLVGLPRRVERNYPSQLSGGQRQRVAIARALIPKPRIVICDEPTSALDVSVQSQILNLLSDLQKHLGLTYLLISHNLSVVEHLADKMFVMYLGRIVEAGITSDIFDKPLHPYTEVLLNAALTPTPNQGIPDLQLGSDYPNPINQPSGCAFHPRCSKIFEPCKTKRPLLVATDKNHLCACHLYPGSSTTVFKQ